MSLTTVGQTVEYIFEVLEKSGMYLTDFSRITGISRVALYRWRKGNPIADKLRLNLAYQAAYRLEKACRLGLLPLHNKYKKVERIKLLRKIVADMASKIVK